jgi:hypothetical protein
MLDKFELFKAELKQLGLFAFRLVIHTLVLLLILLFVLAADWMHQWFHQSLFELEKQKAGAGTRALSVQPVSD